MQQNAATAIKFSISHRFIAHKMRSFSTDSSAEKLFLRQSRMKMVYNIES